MLGGGYSRYDSVCRRAFFFVADTLSESFFLSRTPRGLEDVSKYPDLLATLLEDPSWTEEDVKKLAGQNFLRVFKQVENVRTVPYQTELLAIFSHVHTTRPTRMTCVLPTTRNTNSAIRQHASHSCRAGSIENPQGLLTRYSQDQKSCHSPCRQEEPKGAPTFDVDCTVHSSANVLCTACRACQTQTKPRVAIFFG